MRDSRRVYPGAKPLTKEKITIRLDADILDYFRGRGGGYQTEINGVLRQHIGGKKRAPSLADTLRQVLRDKLRKSVLKAR